MHLPTVDELLMTTRAVRNRLDLARPVAPELIRECLQLALQAPSGSSRQDWRFVVVTERETVAQIGALYRECFEQHYAPSVTVGESDKGSGVDQRVYSSAEHLAQVMEQLPALLVPCIAGRVETLDSTHAQAGHWGSILPAVWSFMLAARSRGLGTVLTTMHLAREREAAEILGIPFARYSQAGLVPIAHTIGTKFRHARRRPLEDVVCWNRWAEPDEERR